MKTKIILFLLASLQLSIQQINAQCNTATVVTGGNCEGTTLQAKTTGGTLRQLLWNWQSRNDSTVLISTADVRYDTGTIVAGGNGYDNDNPLYLAADNQCSPGGIFVDKAGNLYLADNISNRVQKWAPGAKEGITVAGGNGEGSAPNQLSRPFDVAADDAGNIYIADAGNNRVVKWAPDAKEGITVAGGNGGGYGSNQLYDPRSLCLDVEGNLYVADYLNDRVQKWAPNAKEGVTVAGGNYGGSAANQIHHPYGICLDKEGNLYIAGDGLYSHRVQKWAPDAKEGVTVAGGIYHGNKSNQLNYPTDVSVDDYGNVFVVDEFNHRIQRWSPGVDTGVTVVGGFLQLVDYPNNICMAGDTIYESDIFNYAVKRFIPNDEIPKIDTTYTTTNGGKYTATAKFQQGCASTSPAVFVKGLPKFKSIVGQHRNLCGGGTFTYSVDALGEADSYNWVAPAGCTITNGQGTASITLSIPSSFISGVLSVNANNKCGAGPVFSDTLTTKPVKPGDISGPVSLSTYDTASFSVVPQPGIRYHWEIHDAGVQIISGQNTPSITVTWNSFLDQNVIVKATACSGGTESSNRLFVSTGALLSSANTSALTTKSISGLKVYPNPAQDKVVVAFAATGAYNIQLSDATGKIMQKIKGIGTAGENRVTLNLSNISNGLYFVTLTDEKNNKQVVKLTKQ